MCQLSRGALIAHWDDDDWQAPDRLSRQVQALRDSNAMVTGSRQLLHYDLMRGEAWLYRRSLDESLRLTTDLADTSENHQFFADFKLTLRERFEQIEIYMVSFPVEII